MLRRPASVALAAALLALLPAVVARTRGRPWVRVVTDTGLRGWIAARAITRPR